MSMPVCVVFYLCLACMVKDKHFNMFVYIFLLVNKIPFVYTNMKLIFLLVFKKMMSSKMISSNY